MTLGLSFERLFLHYVSLLVVDTEIDLYTNVNKIPLRFL